MINLMPVRAREIIYPNFRQFDTRYILMLKITYNQLSMYTKLRVQSKISFMEMKLRINVHVIVNYTQVSNPHSFEF